MITKNKKLNLSVLLSWAIILSIAFTGDPRTETSNYWHLIALNKVANIKENVKFGINLDIDAGQSEDVWYGGGCIQVKTQQLLKQ